MIDLRGERLSVVELKPTKRRKQESWYDSDSCASGASGHLVKIKQDNQHQS
jgi:hypothetical protein